MVSVFAQSRDQFDFDLCPSWQSGNLDGASGRFGFAELFFVNGIHFRKFRQVGEVNGCFDDIAPGTPGGLKDRRKVLKDQFRLLLNRFPPNLARSGVQRDLTCRKKERTGNFRLAVRANRRWSIRGRNRLHTKNEK